MIFIDYAVVILFDIPSETIGIKLFEKMNKNNLGNILSYQETFTIS